MRTCARQIAATLLLIFWPGTLLTTPAQRSVFFSQNRPAVSGVTHYMLSGTITASLRSDGPYDVGYMFTANAVTATSICRPGITGNTQTHHIYLYNVTTTSVVASGSINAALGTTGTPQCVAISAALISGDNYAVVSQEFSGGDQWYTAQSFTVDSTFTSSTISSMYFTSDPPSGAGNFGLGDGQVYDAVNITR